MTQRCINAVVSVGGIVQQSGIVMTQKVIISLSGAENKLDGRVPFQNLRTLRLIYQNIVLVAKCGTTSESQPHDALYVATAPAVDTHFDADMSIHVSMGVNRKDDEKNDSKKL